MAQRDLLITFTAHDRGNKRNLYMKADGQRFGDSQTIKVSCDVKYDVTVTIKPPLQKLEKLVIGGDEITPDSSKEGESSSEYQFSWITNGFQPTKSGKRSELSFSFKFENAQVLNKLQVKFYPQEKGSHLTWGTEIHRIEYEVRGIEHISKGSEATPYKTLAPHNINFR